VDALAASADLDIEALAPQNVGSLARLDRRLGRLESFPLGALRRFDRADRFLSELLDRLGVECKWPMPRPTVTGSSIDDYWIDPSYPLIFAPADWRCLLGLPALAHELAHPLWGEQTEETSPGFKEAIDTYVSTQGLDEADEQLLLSAWSLTGKWTTEFACDAIATFLIGEAYPWQHLRHLIRSGARPFEPTFRTPAAAQVHPADVARVRLCGLMLGQLGLSATAIESEVADYLGVSGEREPAAYAQTYPDSILFGIASAVADLLRRLGVVPVSSAPAAGVTSLFNQAWTEYRTSMAAYASWEAATFRTLKAP